MASNLSKEGIAVPPTRDEQNKNCYCRSNPESETSCVIAVRDCQTGRSIQDEQDNSKTSDDNTNPSIE